MKTGLSTSLILHAAAIAFGLVTLAAPKAHDAGDVQAFPVDMVTPEEFTQAMQGDKTASVKEKPAPKPTERKDAVLDAKNIGENEVDLEDLPKPVAKPVKVETAAAPKVEPAPVPAPKPVEVKQPEPKPVPVAQPEPAPKPEPAPAPDPIAEAITADATPQENLDFPAELPKPEARPEPPKPQVAKVEEPKKPEKQPEKQAEKKPEKPAKETAKAPKQEDLEALTEEIAALLDKRAPAGGGAKRSEQQAAIGTDKPSNAEKLSVGEMDALRQQFFGCWSPPAGVENVEELKVSVRFNLDRSGKVEGVPTVKSSSGNRQFDESALRAIPICDRQGIRVPKDKYETWSEVVVNFDLSDMF